CSRAGPNGPNNAMLIISRSKVEAYGTEGAVCDFGRGITIKDCYITKPAGGKISDDHRSIVDIGSNISDTVSIDTEETLSDVFFTKDSVPAVGCHMTVDIGRMAELDETLNKAYKANQVEYRWYRNGVWVSSAETKTFDLTSDSRYAEIYVIVFWDDYHIESTHYQVKEIPFEDVKPDRFFYQPVVWAYYHEPQITTGTDETHFSPNNTCTRGQAVTFLWRAMGAPEPLSHNNPFKDVKADKYYYKAVLWALENNVTTGTSPDTFSPNENVTRGQIVTFLYRAKSEPAVSGSMPFKDVKSGSYCYKPVLWAYQNDITTGTTPSTFSPNDFCTRGQIVTFLYRAVVSE
ncbi:MAG: S-layer homology domain-containing protein, partial [Solobacterium sp.]|nr:S-layer homology domain-containing protein [Solobacterium sp.]